METTAVVVLALLEQLAASEALNAELARKNATQHASLARLFLDLEQLSGELQDARRHSHETEAWAHNILREVGQAHSDLLRAEAAWADIERSEILSEVIESLGRIVDPTSADLGEPE